MTSEGSAMGNETTKPRQYGSAWDTDASCWVVLDQLVAGDPRRVIARCMLRYDAERIAEALEMAAPNIILSDCSIDHDQRKAMGLLICYRCLEPLQSVEEANVIRRAATLSDVYVKVGGKVILTKVRERK